MMSPVRSCWVPMIMIPPPSDDARLVWSTLLYSMMLLYEASVLPWLEPPPMPNFEMLAMVLLAKSLLDEPKKLMPLLKACSVPTSWMWSPSTVMLLELTMSIPTPLFVEPLMVNPAKVMLLAPLMAKTCDRLAPTALPPFQLGSLGL